MSIKDSLQVGLNGLIQRTGLQIGITYYTQVVGSVWDDESVLTVSGNTLWTSGIILPVGQADAVLVQQGKLLDSDQRLYTHGSLSFVGSEMQVEVQLGSRTTTDEIYTMVPGGINPQVEDVRIYKKVFIRKLTIGSLANR